MSMLLGGKGERKPELNVTPLIDVLLVLLIILMVLTPTKGLKALVPQESDAPAPPRDDVVVTVTGTGAVLLNQEPVPIADLERRLRTVFLPAVHHVLFVRGAKGLDYQYVVQVIDIARGAGITRVALMTQ